MSDRVVLVTGSTDGIGRQTALDLARKGFTVLVHGRSQQKAERVRDELRREAKGLEAVWGDFDDLDQVRALAEDVKRRFPNLHVLVNNAGIFATERRETKQGLEATFGVNHLAPFLLTRELLPLLRSSGHGRVVNVSSIAHSRGRIDLDDLQMTRGYSGYAAYANSKLANVLFTFELARRVKDVTANALHPGVIGTKLLREGFGSMGGASLEDGALTSVLLASAPELEGVTGKYFANGREASPSSAAQDVSLQQRLWTESEQLIDGR